MLLIIIKILAVLPFAMILAVVADEVWKARKERGNAETEQEPDQNHNVEQLPGVTKLAA